MYYVRDRLGRIGKLHSLHAPTSIEYTFGVRKIRTQRAIEEGLRVLDDAQQAQDEWEAQRKIQWEGVTRYSYLSERLAKKFFHRVHTVTWLECHHNIGIEALCEACLTHHTSQSVVPKPDYIYKALYNRYCNYLLVVAKQQREMTNCDSRAVEHSHDEKEHSKNKKQRFDTIDITTLDKNKPATVIDLQELCVKAGLSNDDLQLLLMRFDSEMPLREIADAIGVASPTTVAKRIESLLCRLRTITTATTTTEPTEPTDIGTNQIRS